MLQFGYNEFKDMFCHEKVWKSMEKSIFMEEKALLKEIKIMKKLIVLLLALGLIFTLVACDNEENEETPVQDEQFQNEHDAELIGYAIEANREWYENYTFTIRNIPLPEMNYDLQATLIRSEIVYFCFVESSEEPNIILISVDANSGEVNRTEMALNSQYTQIVGFDFTSEGNIAIYAVEFDDEFNEVRAVFYAEYSMSGEEVFRRDFSEIFAQVSDDFEQENVVFAADGNIAVSVWNGLVTEIYLLNLHSDEYTVLELGGRPFNMGIVRLDENRILAIEYFPTFALRELNLSDKDWGENIPFVPRSVYSLFPAGGVTDFDFLASDGIYLYGYNMETNQQTVLLNSMNLGFTHVIYAYEMASGELILLSGNWERNVLTPELYILSHISRDAQDERTIITIGQIAAPAETFPIMIAQFNNASDTYRIEVIDYFDYDADGGFLSGVESGLTRLQLEIIAGGGPDIIFLWDGFSGTPEFLLDLYPLIDADPELNRSDFLPNMLAALESPDNTLRTIAEYFTLRTIIGIPEAAAQIDNFTPQELLRFVSQTYATHYPFHPIIDAEIFIRMILTYSGAEFIDWYTMESNLDSEAFIDVLEAARIINGVNYRGGGMWPPQPDELMMRGEQLLSTQNFFGWGAFRHHLMFPGEFEVLGIPTVDGGENVLVPFMHIGINAASENVDGAWLFLRNFLLPDGHMQQIFNDGTLPYRIDIFEQLLAEISTPIMEADEDGNLVEQPQSEIWVDSGAIGFDIINVYAMPIEQVERLRDIVENAVPMRGRPIFQGLWDLISADISRFLSGEISAEDTARVMQSRVSIYLAERS